MPAICQAGQLAVPHDQKVGSPDARHQPLPDRNVERIIRLFARDGCRRQGQPHRVERTQNLLELPQIGAMVFAVPIAHQPVLITRIVMDRDGRHINAGRVARQGVSAQHVLSQFLFDLRAGRASFGPRAGLRGFSPQPTQQERQTVIAEIFCAHRFAQRLAQTLQVCARPFLHGTQKMRASNDHVCDEHQSHFAIAEAFPIAVGRLQDTIDDRVHLHLLEPIDE